MSTMSCIPASTRSNAPLYPARVLNNVSVAALSGNSPGTSCVETAVAASLAMISRQSSTHSSQMNTPGPETSVFTSVCAFPQKEQRYTRLLGWLASACNMIFLRRQHQDDSQPCVDIWCQLDIDNAAAPRGKQRPE